MKRYLKIWLMLAVNAFQDTFSSRFGAFVLIAGKILRFGFFLLFLSIITNQIKMIAGYTQWQIIFFYLTFQLLDTLPQMFLREVYRFRDYVVSGDFDYFLVKPLPPLFRSLFGGADILDLPMLIISIIAIIIASPHLGTVSFLGVVSYIFLLLNACLIAVGFHIVVLSLGVVSTEIDNAIMLYRDLTQMGRVPIDVYTQPLRSLITFVVPVGIMMTIPAKAFMGVLSLSGFFIAVLVSCALFSLSLIAWKYALREYASASS